MTVEDDLAALASDDSLRVDYYDTLANACRSAAVETGLAWYELVADALQAIYDGFGEQGILRSHAVQIHGVLSHLLPLIVDSSDAGEAASLAADLRRSVRRILYDAMVAINDL